MKKSAAHLPHLPIALKAISEKERQEPVAFLAWISLMRQTKVRIKLRSMQMKPQSQPAFLKFFGE